MSAMTGESTWSRWSGNLLLNISPTWDGTIPPPQQTILSTLGTFLRQNGTAIYNTRAWAVYGEGPTKMGGGSFTNPTARPAAIRRGVVAR
jgi:alpha-L-fucosidase